MPATVSRAASGSPGFSATQWRTTTTPTAASTNRRVPSTSTTAFSRWARDAAPARGDPTPPRRADQGFRGSHDSGRRRTPSRGRNRAHDPGMRSHRSPECHGPLRPHRPHPVSRATPAHASSPGGRMPNTSPAHQPRRSRTVRGLTTTAAAGLVLAALPSGVALADGPPTDAPQTESHQTESHSTASHHTWVVAPWDSIQAAVDHAASGDTIRIEAGTYQEAVCVDGKGLTIV